jgi:hypothetical protein
MAPPRQTKAKPGRAPKSALEIAEQLHVVRKMLTMGRSPFEIRQALALQYGLPERTAERRALGVISRLTGLEPKG